MHHRAAHQLESGQRLVIFQPADVDRFSASVTSADGASTLATPRLAAMGNTFSEDGLLVVMSTIVVPC